MEPKKILDQSGFNNSLRSAFSIAFQAIAALWSDAEKKAIANIREYATFVMVDDDALGTNAEYFLGGEWPREDIEPQMYPTDAPENVQPQPKHIVTYTADEAGNRVVETDNWDGMTVMLPFGYDGGVKTLDYRRETQYQFCQPTTEEEVQP